MQFLLFFSTKGNLHTPGPVTGVCNEPYKGQDILYQYATYHIGYSMTCKEDELLTGKLYKKRTLKNNTGTQCKFFSN